jgi:hypothetical protein
MVFFKLLYIFKSNYMSRDSNTDVVLWSILSYKNIFQFYGRGSYYDSKRLTQVTTSLKSLKQYGLISPYAVRIKIILPMELTKANLNTQKLYF